MNKMECQLAPGCWPARTCSSGAETRTSAMSGSWPASTFRTRSCNLAASCCKVPLRLKAFFASWPRPWCEQERQNKQHDADEGMEDDGGNGQDW